MSRSRLVLAGIVAAAAAAPAAAFAHCTAPEINRPMLRDSAPNEIELFMNFGSALSTDNGATWKLQCEEVYQPLNAPIGPNNELYTPAGTLVLASFLGLLTTADQGCGYQQATGIPPDPSDPSGGPEPVQDAQLDPSDPNNKVWVAIRESIHRSIDGGKSVTLFHTFDNLAMAKAAGNSAGLLGLLVAPSDPKTLYVSAFLSDANPLRFLVEYSFDSGTTWRETVSAWGRDDLRILFVAKDNPKRVYVARSDADTNGQRLYTMDFDATAEPKITELVVPSTLTGFNRRFWPAEGSAAGELWVGVHGDDCSDKGGELWHSTDGGKNFTAVAGQQPHFRCLYYMRGQLWACGNNLHSVASDKFGLGVSSDGGKNWTSKFNFGDLCAAMDCISEKCKPILSSTCVPGLCTSATDAGADGKNVFCPMPGGDDAGQDEDAGPPPPPDDAGGAGGGGGNAGAGGGSGQDAKDAPVSDGSAGAGGSGGNKSSGCRTGGGQAQIPGWVGFAFLAVIGLSLARRKQRP